MGLAAYAGAAATPTPHIVFAGLDPAIQKPPKGGVYLRKNSSAIPRPNAQRKISCEDAKRIVVASEAKQSRKRQGGGSRRGQRF